MRDKGPENSKLRILKCLVKSEKGMSHIQEHQCSLLNHYDTHTSLETKSTSKIVD